MFDFWGRYTLDKIFDTPDGWEVQNMLLTGALIAQSALWRTESRGTHWREFHPDRDPSLAVHDLLKRRRTEPRTEPVIARQSQAGTEPKPAQPVSDR
jgi:L-aspartate oxidase